MGRVALLVTVLACSLSAAADGEDFSCAYFPWGAGKTWKYSVTSRVGQRIEKPVFQTVPGRDLEQVGQSTAYAIGDDFYSTAEDGVYHIARKDGGKVLTLPKPVKVIPLEPTTGAWWKHAEGTATTTGTCLGTRAIENLRRTAFM